jgi:hypothetical protein
MERIAVNSSNLRSVGYDPVEEMLEVEFHSGGVYQYFEVPLEIYQALIREPSKGKYFAEFINEKYRFRRIPFFT